MTYGKKGEHRHYRSGGKLKRKNGEIFINTFQGKLAEYGIWNEFAHRNLKVSNPDLKKFRLGQWDDFDLKYGPYKIAVKSTKFYGNLLLLEKKDWNDDGIYIPNMDKQAGYYDYLVLIRIHPDGEKIMKQNKILYTDNLEKSLLREIIINEKNDWSYDIPGFITHYDLCEIIKNKQIIQQASILNYHTKMDADNYYIQAGDMNNINKMFAELANIEVKEIQENISYKLNQEV